LNQGGERDARIDAIPDVHGHAKGEHKPFAEERPIPYTARMLFLWFFHACQRSSPRFMMVADHMNYLTFEDPAAVNLVRRALKLAHAGDLYGASETAGIEVGHAAVVSEGLRRGMRYSIGAEVDNDPRSRPDAQNIVDAMRPDAIIRSVHFLTIEHPELGAGYQWAFDNSEFQHLFAHVGTERVWELYMATLLDAIEKLPGHIVGHFYVPAKFGHWPEDAKLDHYENQLLDACVARGMAIELNARFFYRHFVDDEHNKRRYRNANLRLLKKAKARGVGIAVGSDAHSPKDQGGGFEAVLELLDKAGINEIVFPVNGRMARVALRATEELLKQQAAPPPPPIGSSVSGFGRAELAARDGGIGPEPETPAQRKAAAKAAAIAKAAAAKAAAIKAAADRAAAKKLAAEKAAAKKIADAAKRKALAEKKKIAAAKKAAAKKVALEKKRAAKRAAAERKKLANEKKRAAKQAALEKKRAVAAAKRIAAEKQRAAAAAKKVQAARKAVAAKKAAAAKKAGAAKKAAVAKKAAAKKAAAKKATARKPAAKKAAKRPPRGKPRPSKKARAHPPKRSSTKSASKKRSKGRR